MLHHWIVAFIVWYLQKRCGGAVHFGYHGAYKSGYAVKMNEDNYHNYQALVSGRTEAEIVKMIWSLRDAGFTVY